MSTDWKQIDEKLIRRGMFILDLSFMEGYEEELAAFNQGKVGPLYRLIPRYIQLLAAVRYLYARAHAKGDIGGLAFTAGGPFGMFVIAFWLINRYSIQDVLLGSIKLFLYFPEEQYPVSPPIERADYNQASCWYTVYSEGREVKPREDANIRFEDENPYITVDPQEVMNPSFDVKIEYNGHQFISDSFSPIKRTGRAPLR